MFRHGFIAPLGALALAGCADVTSQTLHPKGGETHPKGVPYHLAKTDLLVDMTYEVTGCDNGLSFGFAGAAVREDVVADTRPEATFIIDPKDARGPTKTLSPLRIETSDGLLTKITYDPADRTGAILQEGAKLAGNVVGRVALQGAAPALGGYRSAAREGEYNLFGGGYRCNAATRNALAEATRLRAAQQTLGARAATLLAKAPSEANAKAVKALTAQSAALDERIADRKAALRLTVTRRVPFDTLDAAAYGLQTAPLRYFASDFAAWIEPVRVADAGARDPGYALRVFPTATAPASPRYKDDERIAGCYEDTSSASSAGTGAETAAPAFRAADPMKEGGVYYRIPATRAVEVVSCSARRSLMSGLASIYQEGALQELELANRPFQDNSYTVVFANGAPTDFTYTDSIASLEAAVTAANAVVDEVTLTTAEQTTALEEAQKLVAAQRALEAENRGLAADRAAAAGGEAPADEAE